MALAAGRRRSGRGNAANRMHIAGRQPFGRRPFIGPRHGPRRRKARRSAEPVAGLAATVTGHQTDDPGAALLWSGRFRFLGGAAAARAARTGCRLLLLVALARRVPALFGLGDNARRRLDVMGASPGQPLLGRVAATGFPALLGRLAAAGVVLARERLAGVLDERHGNGEADGTGEVADQGRRDKEAPANACRKMSESPSVHGRMLR
jgi:hypothetical protein